MNYTNKMALIILFAIAMGYLESAVVVYIIKIINLQGLSSALHPLTHLLRIGADFYWTEIFREASTIIMLGAVALICAGSIKRIEKAFYYFMLSFGVWDVFYYIFLKVLINWPQTILDPDCLFAIPVIWASPVLAPVLISISLIGISLIMLKKMEDKKYKQLGIINRVLILAGSSIIVMLTFWTSYTIINGEVIMQTYNWALFMIGLVIFILGFIMNYLPFNGFRKKLKCICEN